MIIIFQFDPKKKYLSKLNDRNFKIKFLTIIQSTNFITIRVTGLKINKRKKYRPIVSPTSHNLNRIVGKSVRRLVTN